MNDKWKYQYLKTPRIQIYLRTSKHVDNNNINNVMWCDVM